MTLQYHKPLPYFDFDWGPRKSLAVRFLSGVCDAWCRADDRPFPVRRVVAVLIHVFSPRFSADPKDAWRRSIPDWLESVADPETEFAATWPHRPDDGRSILLDLDEVIRRAAESWNSSDPAGQPSAEKVVHDFVDVLVARRLVTICHG
jgi:hypothetical protein